MAWYIDFFHNILSSSLVLFRVGSSVFSCLFGVMTLLKMACLQDPVSTLLGLPSSEVVDLGLFPTFRKLKRELGPSRLSTGAANTYMSIMGDLTPFSEPILLSGDTEPLWPCSLMER